MMSMMFGLGLACADVDAGAASSTTAARIVAPALNFCQITIAIRQRLAVSLSLFRGLTDKVQSVIQK